MIKTVELPQTPFYVELEVTSSCNLSCRYCFAKPLRGLMPSYDELDFLLEKTRREANPFQIVLMGGEPFLRKDIIRVLTRTKELFGDFGISTNGTMLPRLSSSALEELKGLVEERTIQVSIDSLDDSINSFGRGGTQQVLRGMDVLERASVPFTAGIVVFQANANDLASTIRRLLKRYRKSLRAINLNRLMPSFVLGADFYNLKLSPTEYVKATSVAHTIVKDLGREDVAVFIEKEDYKGCVKIDELGSEGCLQGITRAEVFSNGDVGPCSMLRNAVIGNLYRESWRDIWKRALETSCSMLARQPGMLCQALHAGPENALKLTVSAPSYA